MDIGTTMPKVEWDRVPITISFAESPAFAETHGFVGTQGLVWLEGQRLLPRDRPSDTVYLFMHPASTLQLLPMPTALADAGLHVICAGSRYPKNDSALIMEKVCFDLSRYVRWAKEEAGYRKVVLVGWSGGGSLSLFYQSQAEHPSITHTAAGDPYDLVTADMPPADGVIFIAAHLSRAETVTELLDPSVTNELDPSDRDLEFDIYDPACPHQPPYTADFVARFRAAQVARNRRITSWAEAKLAEIKARADGEVDFAFVVHRTRCDVRRLDPSIDPNGRAQVSDPLREARTANSIPAGLARFCSLRSWLSQWSYNRSQAKGPASAARITRAPVLLIENEADANVPASHGPAIFAALATRDKEMRSIAGATHYYFRQPQQMQECIDAVVDWSRRKGFL
ncbi:MAG: alpha/beta hydrolase [Bradyrhizobium sp.]|nr:alpha/beta hydrolase [Bradyrhizobium sp.]